VNELLSVAKSPIRSLTHGPGANICPPATQPCAWRPVAGAATSSSGLKSSRPLTRTRSDYCIAHCSRTNVFLSVTRHLKEIVTTPFSSIGELPHCILAVHVYRFSVGHMRVGSVDCHKTCCGSTRNHGGSPGKRLGVKKFSGALDMCGCCTYASLTEPYRRRVRDTRKLC